ncbi:glycosyltransferase family protein [Candidatus Pelagibacter sp. HIMB1483]|uniref:glycosyltransferase family protein n=1 Tax=Candidatus Pelagibacter sp. HIMB1483 TaxID=3415414 RepID=UPI003F8538F4
MKIASILPYKENYTEKGAGAVALWISEFMRDSIYKKNIFIFGNTSNKKFLTKNYINININTINSRLSSTTKEYSNRIIKKIQNMNFDIIELHNRPIMIREFYKKTNSKIILYFHNDPTTMKGAKTVNDRIYLLNSVDKIIFITKWVKKKFFEGLPNLSDNKTQIIYHSIDPFKKKVKKNKQIIFVGKLNESKGYDLYCKAMFKVLDFNKDWIAYSIGEEKRFQNFPTHIRHKSLGQIPHNKVLKYLSKSEIAIIPSRWEEPFGRTSMEASSRGCATIISNKGGLPETTDYAIKLKKLDVRNIEIETIKLIKNKSLRKKIQLNSQMNIKHNLKNNSKVIDLMRSSLFPFKKINFLKNKLRIINIYNLAQKLNHRIYNLSLGKKFTNGFIRNGHDVIEISDRDFVRQNKRLNFLNFKDKFHEYLIETFRNYNPNLIIFGHSDNINQDILTDFRSLNKNIIISQWNEDPLMKNLPDTSENIHKLNKFLPFVDHSFITTSPSVVNLPKKYSKNIHFFMTPVDKNIECFDVFKHKPENDIFYAMSHGVNRATLKVGKTDNRVVFLEKLIKKIDGIKYDFYGIGKQEPVWGNEFYKSLLNSKMALNLSRGEPTKHYSSNRIASLMGNGLLVFIDKKVEMNKFFNKNEIVFYDSVDDLASRIKFLKKNDKLRKNIARKGKEKYFKLFNETKIAKYIVDLSLGKIVSLT